MVRLRALVASLLAAAALLGATACQQGEDEGTTTTLPPAEGTVVWAIGDGGIQGEPSRKVAALVAKEQPDQILYLGDVYSDGTAKEYRTNFADVYGDLVELMWPTPGNHEWANREEGYGPFWKRVYGEPLPYFYAREAGGWQVLSANSQDIDDDDQPAWLRERASEGGNCRLLFMHRPRVNAGKRKDEQGDVAELWDAVKGGAALVVSGHDHNLQRFKPVDGMVQYISGGGGKDLYDVDESDPRLAFSADEVYGGLRIELKPGTATLTFISADGKLLDRSTVTCREG